MKFPVQSFESITAKLDSLGAIQQSRITEEDSYFNHPQRDFARTDEALRIRESGDNVLITYKGPKLDQITKTREEIEVALVNDAQVALQCTSLLKLLGFRPVATVCKQRVRYELGFANHDLEVTLDEVSEVGRFVEIEIRADEAQLEQAKLAVQSLAVALGLSASERRSYLELLVEGRQRAR